MYLPCTWLISLIFAALLLGPARAEPLQPMENGDMAQGWQGVGRLMLGRRGFCTGVLISPREVLTAGHCLFDKETGARLDLRAIEFQAGWRKGRAEAFRGLRRMAIEPEYIYSGAEALERIGMDLALLELDQPILLPQLPPFALGGMPGPGGKVSVVSYAVDRAEAASMESGCSLLGAEGVVQVLSCDIDFGASGAPVFVTGPEGPQVVALISAKAELDGHKVALAVPTAPGVAKLRAMLGPLGNPGKVEVLSGGGAAAGQSFGGAKFVRP